MQEKDAKLMHFNVRVRTSIQYRTKGDVRLKRHSLKKLNIAAVLLALILTGCGNAAEDALVSPEIPEYNAMVPKTAEVIRGDLTPQYSARLDLLGYERVHYQFTQAEYEEMYGSYQLKIDEILVNVGDFVEKGEVMVSFHSDMLDKQIRDYEKQIEDARLSIEHLKRLSAIDPTEDHSDEIASLNREIQVAGLYIDDIEETYRKLNLISESDGFVSFISTTLREGYVTPGSDLILVDKSRGLYTTEKTEGYDFKPGEIYTAHLGKVEHRVEVVETPEGEDSGKVYFMPLDGEDEMPEKNLMLEFELPAVKDACYVNRQAVYDKDDIYFVYVVQENGMRRAVEVTPGDKIGNYLIIKEGLNGGENVELP